MISCFVFFYLADRHLGRRRGSCGLNCGFPFVIALCFVFFHDFCHHLCFFPVSFAPSCLLRTVDVVSLPLLTLWRPCTSGTVEVCHPSWWWFPLGHTIFWVRHLGFSYPVASWTHPNLIPNLAKKKNKNIVAYTNFLVYTSLFLLGLAYFIEV